MRSEYRAPGEQLLDLAEREAVVPREANDPESEQHVLGVVPPAAPPLGRGQEPEPFVVADRGRPEPRSPRHVADPHGAKHGLT